MLQPAKQYQSYNPPYSLPPIEAAIVGIYGTAILPDGSRKPVRVLHVETPFTDKTIKVIIVKCLEPSATPFEIDREKLVFVQVFAVLGGR